VIVCGTDLSPASGGALAVAHALAARTGDRELVLVHVVDESDEDARVQALDAARAPLDAQARTVIDSAGAPTVRAELVAGTADETLISYADTENAELIVIAAQSRTGSLLSLGSTAERVVAGTRVPVLVVRDAAPWLAFARGERPLKILVGIDDSVACDLVIQWTHALRARGSVDVVLGAIYYPDEAAEVYGLAQRALVERDPEVEKLLERDLVRRFGSSDRVTSRARRGLGRVGDHILELARDEQVDAIVVGTAQRTGLGRLGSVSSVIVHDAPQSIVCVPPNAQIATRAVPQVNAVLVATDLSSFSNRAVPHAFALARGGDVHVAHVVGEDAEIDEADVLRALRALAPVGGEKSLTVHIVRGDDAALAIAQAAARLGVDVICIASHGRTGITRALVGSVADRLLRATRKPVLVLRPG
jgi:nucleotide-binding universal stress UspA family protein